MVYGVQCSHKQSTTYTGCLHTLYYPVYTQLMHSFALCVMVIHITGLQWQTVIYTKGLTILHVMCVVGDLQFNV
jgi:hypothetical protein